MLVLVLHVFVTMGCKSVRHLTGHCVWRHSKAVSGLSRYQFPLHSSLRHLFLCTGDHSAERHHHNTDAVSGVDCVLHHSSVLAAALHMGGAWHHTEICLPDWVLGFLPVCLLRHRSAVAGLPQDGE